MSSTIRLTVERLDGIMQYVNDYGETQACEHFKISIETLHRYERFKRFNETLQPKILLLDVENARMLFGGWRIGEQRVTSDQILKDWFLLGWSAKWLFDSKIMSEFVTSKEALKRDDKRICKGIWRLMNDADIIITHNGIRSDIPKLNTRLLINGFPPPMPYQNIDTFKIIYKQFQFGSASLNYLSKILLRKEKLHTDYQLWIDCENGIQKSIDFMEKYCKKDTQLLEDVYIEIRGWIKSHPNLPVIMNAQEPCCVNCGGFEFEKEEGFYPTAQNRYVAMRCKGCGAISHQRKSVLKTTQRKVLLVPNAR